MTRGKRASRRDRSRLGGHLLGRRCQTSATVMAENAREIVMETTLIANQGRAHSLEGLGFELLVDDVDELVESFFAACLYPSLR